MATVDDVRTTCLSLPETSERLTWGTPGFRVRDELFARLREAPDALLVRRPSVEDRDSLIAADPDVFLTTPHDAGHASVLVRLDVVEVDHLRELLTEAMGGQSTRPPAPPGPPWVTPGSVTSPAGVPPAWRNW